MGIFTPADISFRITHFISGQIDFPYIKRDEIIGIFFIYGKNGGISNQQEIEEAKDLARRTIDQVAKDASMYGSFQKRLDPAVTRENYTKRMLQIAVDTKGLTQKEVNERVAGDPTILLDCFAQHIAFYRQEFYFEIFGPMKRHRLQLMLLPPSVQEKLESRMLLLGYNVKNAKILSNAYSSSFSSFSSQSHHPPDRIGGIIDGKNGSNNSYGDNGSSNVSDRSGYHHHHRSISSIEPFLSWFQSKR